METQKAGKRGHKDCELWLQCDRGRVAIVRPGFLLSFKDRT